MQGQHEEASPQNSLKKGSLPGATQRIVFVSGKGGVCKSLIAAALAKELASVGRKTLLAEIGETSYYQDFWRLPHVGHEPTRHPEGFDLCLWSGETCLREYVLYYLKMERLYKLFFENKVMRALVNVAPGLAELAILGKVTSGLRKVGPPLEYDTIVVDCYATGHAMALFQAPKGIREAIGIGPMGHHSREIENILRDPRLSAYLVVTLLEELSVAETLEFKRTLEKEFDISVEVIANRVLEAPAGLEELEQVSGSTSAGLSEFAKYLKALVLRQGKYLEELMVSHATLRKVPQVFSAEPNELVRRAGEALWKA